MAAEEILNLYDSYWFHLNIFTFKQKVPVFETIDKKQHEFEEPILSPVISVQVRAQSLHCLCSETCFSPSSPSPDSVIMAPKLETIFSGKEEKEKQEIETYVTRKKWNKKKQRRNKKGSRSLTDLEFEELKGFMDLGFVFTEEDKDSNLVSIIPGLLRYRKKGDEETSDNQEYKVSRPYLSEAWDVMDQKKLTNSVIDWRLRFPNGQIDMKDLLKVWAQSVASTVK